MIILKHTQPAAIHQAIEHVRAGGLIAFPTDTVYGLGCGLFNTQGILRLYEIKGRDSAKAIAVLLADMDQIDKVTTELSRGAVRLAESCWPGALTLVVPKNPAIPMELSTLPTVGVRMPDHSFARALLRACGPMAVTSANLSGQASAVTAEEVNTQLGGHVPLLIDGGRCAGGTSSTVVDCTGPEPIVLREGPISQETIQAIWHQVR